MWCPVRNLSKVKSLFSIFVRNIFSERYDLNHFMVLSENVTTLSFCNKISWSIVSNAFCRSINIIPVDKSSSNPFKTLSVKKDKQICWMITSKTWFIVIIYLHPIKRHLFGHELPFQWSSKLMEAMRLACS